MSPRGFALRRFISGAATPWSGRKAASSTSTQPPAAVPGAGASAPAQPPAPTSPSQAGSTYHQATTGGNIYQAIKRWGR